LELKNILPQDPESLENFVECIISATLEVNQILELNTSDKIVQKSVRGIIEADSPIQVDVFSLFLAEEIIRSGIKKVSLVGLHFGGSELPFAVKRRINNLDKTIDVQMVSAHYSYYSNRDLSYKNGFLDAQIWKDADKVYLLDDGVFTGSSISKIYDEISRLGFNVTSRVMQIANSRRFGHMQKTGGIDTQYLDAEIAHSAVGVTPSVIIRTLEDFEKQAGTFNSKLIQVSIVRRMKSYYEL